MLHPPTTVVNVSSGDQSQPNQEETDANSSSDTCGVASDGAAGTAATGAGERVCLSVVPVKILAKGSSLSPVETYA